MNILLINHYAGSPIHGMEYRPFHFASEWLKLGHRVHIVAGSYSHLRKVNPTLTTSYFSEKIGGVDYTWLKTPSYTGNGASRAVSLFAFPAQVYRHFPMICRHKIDLVIASSTYPFDILPAKWLARKSSAKLVFEVHDLWPLSPIELGGMSKYHPFIVLLQLCEDYAYKHCHKVVSMLPNAEQYMKTRGLAAGKFVCIPNGIEGFGETTYDAELPRDLDMAIRSASDRGEFPVGYGGAHGVANALESLIHAAHVLRDSKVSFFLVGQGPEKVKLQKLVHDLKLVNVFFFPAITKAVVFNFYKRMNALYIGLQNKRLFLYGVSPNKLMDYLVSGVPVLYAINSGNNAVDESMSGITVPPEDPQGIADGIRKLMAVSPECRKQMGARGKQYVLENHRYDVLAERFLKAVQ